MSPSGPGFGPVFDVSARLNNQQQVNLWTGPVKDQFRLVITCSSSSSSSSSRITHKQLFNPIGLCGCVFIRQRCCRAVRHVGVFPWARLDKSNGCMRKARRIKSCSSCWDPCWEVDGERDMRWCSTLFDVNGICVCVSLLHRVNWSLTAEFHTMQGKKWEMSTLEGELLYWSLPKKKNPFLFHLWNTK